MTNELIHDAITFHTHSLAHDGAELAVANLLFTAYDDADHLDELLATLRHACDEITKVVRSIEEAT